MIVVAAMCAAVYGSNEVDGVRPRITTMTLLLHGQICGAVYCRLGYSVGAAVIC